MPILHFMLLKLCTECLKELPHSEFHLDKSKKDGMHTQCKVCRNNKEFKRFINKNESKKSFIKDLEGEIWKHIITIPFGYMISNKGRCKILARKYKINDTLLQSYINIGGYPCYNIKNKNFRIHRLIGIYFIPNPNNFKVVHHKDANRLNYAIDNLEWRTSLDNNLEKIKMGRHNCPKGEKNASAKLTNEQVKEIYLSYYTLKCLSLKYKISTTVASKIKRGELWRHITSNL